LPAPSAVLSSPSTTTCPPRRSATFASLHVRNYRLFLTGQGLSNVGSWVQRIAQDWLVLTLTGSTVAVGITTALQFVPTVLFGLHGGLLADRYPRRRILLGTQVGMGVFAAVLAALTLSGAVRPWHVFVIAFALGIVVAIDNPARQAFVNEMVGPAQVRNAVSLNSSVFQLGGLVGPALSGVLITAVGPGWSFLINAASYVPSFAALALIRTGELHVLAREPERAGQIREALRYCLHRPDVLWPIVLAGVCAMFTGNLPVTLAAYARSVFHGGAGGYGLLSTIVALGSLAGALISARQPRARLRTLLLTCAALAVAEVFAAAAPGEIEFCIALLGVGALTLLLYTSVNSTVQLAAHDVIRGRVLSVYLMAWMGGAALGGPIVGGIDQAVSPRAGMLLAGLVPGAAAVLVALRLLANIRRGRPLRVAGVLG
jgi:MFS family permease